MIPNHVHLWPPHQHHPPLQKRKFENRKKKNSFRLSPNKKPSHWRFQNEGKNSRILTANGYLSKRHAAHFKAGAEKDRKNKITIIRCAGKWCRGGVHTCQVILCTSIKGYANQKQNF